MNNNPQNHVKSQQDSNASLKKSLHSFSHEVSSRKTKIDDIKVLEVDCTVDCGQVLNLDSARAQMEGAVVMSTGLSLRTEIVFREGAVVNTNFHNYPVLRINEMPKVRSRI